MRLSEQIKQDHDCGDFGKALEGYSERAKILEDAVEEAARTLEHCRYSEMPMAKKLRSIMLEQSE